MSEVYRLSGIRKNFTKGEVVLEVLRGLDFEVTKGEFIAIMGVSGSGKSTLLQLMGALDVPDEGELRLLGRDPAAMSEIKRAELRNREIGFVFQFHHLLGEFTALENVMMPLLIARLSAKESRQRAREQLNELGLEERATHYPAELSGGEQQRVAIARALVNRPGVLLLDEPTGNLDEVTGGDVFELLQDYCRKQKQTVVMATHNRDLAEQADKMYTLEKGVLDC